MKSNLEKAQELLKTGGYTCVLCKGDIVVTTCQRGVKPLIEWIDSGNDFSGYSAADKVIGNGAAFLYVLLNIKEVYASVISKRAAVTLEKYGISFTYDIMTDNIRNRDNTGNCPMEEAVAFAKTPRDAERAIRAKILLMSGK